MPQQRIRHTLAFLLRRHRRIFFLLLCGLALLWHAVLLQLPQGTENIELNSLENAYAQRQTVNQLLGHSTEPVEDILILGFDHTFQPENYQDLISSEPALALLASGGKVEPDHPIDYDRRLFGLILDRLASAGARLVIFDWFFEGPGPFGDEGNLFFSEQIRRHSDRVLLANLLQFQQRNNLNIVTVRDPYEKLLPDEDALLGFVNVWPDSHGCISRHVPAENTLVLSSPQLATRQLPPDIFSLANAAAMRLGRPAPSDGKSEIINFLGPGGSFNKISVQDIFIPSEWKNRFADGAYFKDKIILVGPYSEIHYKDAFRTPVGAMLGVEIQANCLNNALRAVRGLRRPHLDIFPLRWRLAALLPAPPGQPFHRSPDAPTHPAPVRQLAFSPCLPFRLAQPAFPPLLFLHRRRSGRGAPRLGFPPRPLRTLLDPPPVRLLPRPVRH